MVSLFGVHCMKSHVLTWPQHCVCVCASTRTGKLCYIKILSWYNRFFFFQFLIEDYLNSKFYYPHRTMHKHIVHTHTYTQIIWTNFLIGTCSRCSTCIAGVCIDQTRANLAVRNARTYEKSIYSMH